MRTKIIINIGHLEDELTEEELATWLKSMLQSMLDTKGGMTGYTLEVVETNE